MSTYKLGANWIKMSGSLKPDLFYSDKLHVVEKGNFILTKFIYNSVKTCYGFRNNHQLFPRVFLSI